MIPEKPGGIAAPLEPFDGVPLPEELPSLFWSEHWLAFRRNGKLVAAVTLFGVAVGALLASLQTRLFHSATTLEVQGITDNLLNMRDGNPNAGADAELMDIQTQIRIMQSASLIDRVRARLSANASPDALRRAVDSLTVHTAGPTRIVEIGATSTDPRVAANFVNGLAGEFIQQHVEARWQGTQLATERLRGALADVRDKLEKSEQSLQEYARLSGLVLNPDRSSINEDRLRQLQSELSQAQSDRVARQSRWEAVSQHSDADLPAIAGTPAIEAAQAKVTDLRRQIAEMATTYTLDYPKVKRLEAQIAPLEASIAKEVSGIKDRAQSDLDESSQRESLLAESYQAQTQLVSGDAEKKVHYDMLRHEVDSTRALYETMLTRVKEAGLASSLRGSNVRVLDAARVPERPFQPRWLETILLGAMVGIFLGSLLAFHRGGDDDFTVHAPGELGLCLNQPELGAIPCASQSALHPGAVHQILTSLLLTSPPAISRVFAITSAGSGEGKSTLADQLAAASAAIGKRVLLIDGNLHAPHPHPFVLSSDKYGLADLLASPTWLGATEWARGFHKTSAENLEVIPAGNLPRRVSTLVYSPRFSELLEHARKNFEIIFIDTPPVLQMPDARVIGRAADSVLLVARAGKTSREAVLAVCQRFNEDRTPIAGCVLNDWNSRRSPGLYGRGAREFAASLQSARAMGPLSKQHSA